MVHFHCHLSGENQVGFLPEKVIVENVETESRLNTIIKRDKARVIASMHEAAARCKALKIPFVATYFYGGKVIHVGTEIMRKLSEDQDSSSLQTAVRDEVIRLREEDCEDRLEDVEDVRSFARTQVNLLHENGGEDPPLLPGPLSALNKPQKMSWLAAKMKRDQQIQSSSPLNRIKYGDGKLTPRFWTGMDFSKLKNCQMQIIKKLKTRKGLKSLCPIWSAADLNRQGPPPAFHKDSQPLVRFAPSFSNK